jgi:hypothetical protein
MKLRLSILLLAAAALAVAPAAGQTVKSLGYNTTNGQIVYSGSNSLTFTNALQFSTNARATTRTNLGLGGSDSVTFSNLSLSGNGSLAIGGMNLTAISSGIDLAFKRAGSTELELKTNGLILHVGSYAFSGGNTNGASTTRTNLGLGGTNTPTFSNIALNSFPGGASTGFVGRNSSQLALYGTNVTSSVPAFYGYDGFNNTAFSAGTARTNLELGATNNVTFSNITASGTLTATGNATLNGSGNLAPSQTADSASSLMTRELTDARYSFSRWYDANDLLSGAQSVSVNPLISGNAQGHPVSATLVTVSNVNTKFELPVDYRVSGSVKVVSYWTDRTLTNGGTNGDIAVWTLPLVAQPVNNTQTNGFVGGTQIQSTFTANYGGNPNFRYYVMEQTVNLATVTNISATNPMQLKWIELQRRGGDATDTSSDSIYLSGVHIYVP